MHLSNLIKLPGLFQSVYRNARVQKQFIRQILEPDLAKSRREHDDSLNDADFRKITQYYGFAVPAILGEGFCLLRGRELEKQERIALTYLGALTGLFDDFFDEKQLSDHYLKTLMDFPDEAETRNANERLFVGFVIQALQHSPEPRTLKQAAFKVYEAQVLSKKQKDPAIGRDEIRDITLQKGGFSILFYRSAFQQGTSEAEKQMLYHLGGLGQLENDIFDIYKDHVNGIQTLATTTDHIGDLREAYGSLLKKVIGLVHQTAFPVQNKKKFLRFVALIVSRGFVCLDFLEKSEKRTRHTFLLKAYDKKDLICDMGTFKNNLKLLYYYLKCDLGPY